jgi:uncharacterized protein YkwD
MRASLVLPSVLAGVIVVAAGSIWADASGRRTTSIGNRAQLSSSPTAGLPTSAAAATSVTASVSTHAALPSRSASPKTTGAATVVHPAYRATYPSHVAAVPAAQHSCTSSGSTPGASSMEAQIFALLNRQRAANGLCAMTWLPQLHQSAYQHSVLMDQKSSAADCSNGNYSHAYPGEPDIESRIVATGYRRSAVAEAIGCSPDTSLAGVTNLQWMLYNETPPNNQHREMILSTEVVHVGIAIVVDPADSTLWLTEDFAS